MEISSRRILSSGLRNALTSLLLIVAMGGLLATSAQLLFGTAAALWTLVGVAVAALMLPVPRPSMVLAAHRARPLPSGYFADEHAMLRELAGRAGLPAVPRLYLVPGAAMNAFTVGEGHDAAIAVSEGLLRGLSGRELAGVLAHEVAHIAHRDLRTMALAATMGRAAGVLSRVGLLLLVFGLPLVVSGMAYVSPLSVLLLIAAPMVIGLLQLALSRAREFEADRAAAALTGDPIGLAGALHRLERTRTALWRRLFFPSAPGGLPELLYSHPPVQARIDRLLKLIPPRQVATGPWGSYFLNV